MDKQTKIDPYCQRQNCSPLNFQRCIDCIDSTNLSIVCNVGFCTTSQLLIVYVSLHTYFCMPFATISADRLPTVPSEKCIFSSFLKILDGYQNVDYVTGEECG